MISYLKGKILKKTANFIILENQGIGYKVFVTPDILERKLGEELELYTYLKVTDDGQTLFGVLDFPSLQFFELLITVTGVGPKMALTILSSAKMDTLTSAIASQNLEIFTRMSGVGKKTAERIILELKSKITGSALEGLPGAGSSDIYDALVGLGYSAREVREVVQKLDTSGKMETQLKQALKLLSQ